MHFLKGSKSHHSVPVLHLSLWSPGLCPRRWGRAGGGGGGRVSRAWARSCVGPWAPRRGPAARLHTGCHPQGGGVSPVFSAARTPMPGMPLARNQRLNLLLRKNGARPIVSVNGKKNQVSPLASRRDMWVPVLWCLELAHIPQNLSEEPLPDAQV